MKRKALVLKALILATLAFVASTATASSFTIASEVQATVVDTSVVTVTIAPAAQTPGPVRCLLFTCDLTGTDVIYVALSVDVATFSATFGDLNFRIPGLDFFDIRGIGSLASLTATAPSVASVDASGLVTIEFNSPNGIPEGGESEVLFVSYAQGAIHPPSQLIELSIRRDAGDTGVPTGAVVTAAIVPEPASGLLVGCGLVAIGLTRRAHRG